MPFSATWVCWPLVGQGEDENDSDYDFGLTREPEEN
jgi:hypothetical protein